MPFCLKSCFLSLFLEDCFWVAGVSRVRVLWGWNMQLLKCSFSAVPRCIKSENGNKAIEVGVPWFPRGWTVGLPKHPSCAQDQTHGGFASIWKNILRWKEARKESRISSWSIRVALFCYFCSCFVVLESMTEWLTGPPSPTLYLRLNFMLESITQQKCWTVWGCSSWQGRRGVDERWWKCVWRCEGFDDWSLIPLATPSNQQVP